MTDAELQALLAAHDARLRKRLAPWISRAGALVRSKLEDAAAHAAKAITETLRQTPDGRATDRKATRSRSFTAAMARLDELTVALAGPSPRSLEGLVRDARESFYRDSFPMWAEQIDSKFWSSPHGDATQAGADRIRGMPTHDGIDVYLDVARWIDAAKLDLRRAVNAGAATDSARSLAGDRIKTWERTKADQITRLVSLELSDSDMMAWTTAGIDLVHPDYR